MWDENWFGSTKTLDVHVGWLRGKLGDDASAPRCLHTVRGVGFRFTGPVGMGVLTLRARLLLALAYVLVLAIGSMLVPLVRSRARPRRAPRSSSRRSGRPRWWRRPRPATRGSRRSWWRRRRARCAGGW